jgi:hypothetical protein
MASVSADMGSLLSRTTSFAAAFALAMFHLDVSIGKNRIAKQIAAVSG